MPIIAIAMGGILFSCVDSGKDLYDPSYETSNPMGDGFLLLMVLIGAQSKQKMSQSKLKMKKEGYIPT
mgnify:CR=1 FL=1